METGPTRLLEPLYDHFAVRSSPGPHLQDQRAVMHECASTGTDASAVGEVEASVEEMHHVSLLSERPAARVLSSEPG